MEWEKEGAESWALPNYGPSRVPSLNPTNQRDVQSYDTEPENKNNLLLYDNHGYLSDSPSPPSTKSGPPSGDFSSTFSATAESSGCTSRDPKSESIPTGPHGDWHPCTNLSFTLNQQLNGQVKALAQSAAGFRPGKYGVPKGRHGVSTRHQPQTPRKTRPAPSSPRSRDFSSSKDYFSKSKWRGGAAPDASFRLPCGFRAFQERLAHILGNPLCNTDLCDKINQHTGAYVRISAKSAKHIDIWGKKSQVLAAQKMVQGFADEIAQPKRLDEPPDWNKIHAHSNTKVATQKFKEHCDAKVEGLRKAPKIPTDCTLIFLWPQNGPSLSHCLVSRRQMLDDMRKSYDVNIYTKPGVQDCLFLSGDNERDLGRISNELREIWQCLFVQCETEIVLFLVDPPIISIMRTNIVLERLDKFSKAFLYGNRLPGNKAESWNSTAQGFKKENKTAICDHLERALQLVPHFDGVLQMRANFGSFMLEEWRKPVAGNTYSFEEFRDMLRLQNVEGRLLPGLRLPQEEMFGRIKAAKDLLVPWGADRLSSLMKIVPRHSASFEYRVRGDSIIRVEVNFSLPPGSGEFETNGIRCFRPQKISTQRDLKMPMQIGMIDFERSDWQFEVKALSLYQEDDFKVELDRFKRSIAYNWNSSVKSIGSVPFRKANFSPGAPVTRFVEKSAIQLKVIDTTYVFELSRFDEYVSVHCGQWPKTPKVSWGGSLFNPEWDDILGEQAKLSITDVPKDRSLFVFFPTSPEAIREAKEGMNVDEIDEKHEEMCKQKETEQLKIFMSKVQTIARMLGSPDAEMPDVLETDVGTLF